MCSSGFSARHRRLSDLPPVARQPARRSLRRRPERRRPSQRARSAGQGYEFVNARVNGHTSADLLERVDSDIVACRPVAVTILIGTNDLGDGVPVQDYRGYLGAIVDRVKTKTSARIVLLSLPPLGEDLDADINHRLAAYNAVIKETAERAKVDYLPVHERMADHLRKRGGAGTPYDFGFGGAFAAAAEHHLLGRGWDEVARGNDLDCSSTTSI
ncbi:SGNH/GDSL hydrolase family protein [Streptomyces purpureus]|uniref:SGNH/GDSL hydrolase family protein n=1 Tax=Streptomyces purpureus TaxID=1951 RepID=UPI0037AC74F5